MTALERQVLYDSSWTTALELQLLYDSSCTTAEVPEFSWELISAEENSWRAEEEFPVAKPPDRQQRFIHEGKEEEISGHWGMVAFITPIHETQKNLNWAFSMPSGFGHND